MSRKIKHIEDLPDWFDIAAYEEWEDLERRAAVWSVGGRLSFCSDMAMACNSSEDRLAKETIQVALQDLAISAKAPYSRHAFDSLLNVIRREDRVRLSNSEFRALEHEMAEAKRMDEAITIEMCRILGGVHHEHINDIRSVSLLDVMRWMDENKELISEIEMAAEALAVDNGWDREEIKSYMFYQVKLQGDMRESFIKVDGHPTISGELKAIERYLMSHHKSEHSSPSARFSDVRKLFEYRAAAYADLTTWSHLTGCIITKKCMANALFTDGRYGELDMMPSKTIGKFFKRLEEGYIWDLADKAAEMKSMQS